MPQPAGDLGEAERGWFTTPPFSEPETFTFPAGIGPVECVNVEHEEVLLIPRWVQAQRVTFKYGLGAEFIGVLETLHKLGLDSTDPVRVGGASVSPRDVVAACLPDPATLGDKMSGLTCAGTWVTGTGTGRRAARGLPAPRGGQRLVHGRVRVAGRGLADRGQPGGRAGADRLRAPGPARACSAPRRCPPQPFLDLLTDYGSPWACEERTPAGK